RREMAVISGTVYEDLLASWRSLQTTAENIATTAFLRLWESGSPAIFEYLSQSGDDDTRRQMAALATELQSQLKDADEEDDPVNLLAVTMLDRIDALPSDSPLIRQRRHMKRVAQSYRRQGLRAADMVADTPPDGKHDFDTRGRLTGSDHIHALSCGGERLLKLAGFLASMDQPDQSADSQVRNDLEIFSNQFFHLHETTS
ncbi:MAG: hypothetical protein VX665_04030, partial [Pseudomonadota bacterium]|nr:hypothetical protein [Pseudomonadota bacterium]